MLRTSRDSSLQTMISGQENRMAPLQNEIQSRPEWSSEGTKLKLWEGSEVRPNLNLERANNEEVEVDLIVKDAELHFVTVSPALQSLGKRLLAELVAFLPLRHKHCEREGRGGEGGGSPGGCQSRFR